MEVICQAGHDGGLQQHFVLEAIGATSTYFNNLDSTRSTHEIVDNEISTMNDQVSIVLYILFIAGHFFCCIISNIFISSSSQKFFLTIYCIAYPPLDAFIFISSRCSLILTHSLIPFPDAMCFYLSN